MGATCRVYERVGSFRISLPLSIYHIGTGTRLLRNDGLELSSL